MPTVWGVRGNDCTRVIWQRSMQKSERGAKSLPSVTVERASAKYNSHCFAGAPSVKRQRTGEPVPSLLLDEAQQQDSLNNGAGEKTNGGDFQAALSGGSPDDTDLGMHPV